jgi:hypothetical protein
VRGSTWPRSSSRLPGSDSRTCGCIWPT